jgi:nicotinamidase-related amidase
MAQNNSKNEKAAGRKTALLIIDVITDFEFEDGDKLLIQASRMAPHLARFKKKAKAAGMPVIYINDNFGKWQEDFKTILKHCLKASAKGKKFVEQLKPDKDDYYILKPQRSAFHLSALELLLENLGVETLILTGLTTDICILFTGNDAYMRNYNICIPRDCVCAITPKIHKKALEFIERVLKADTTAAGELDLIL